MKLAIMQPYIFPYIGYFQMINVVDEFVVYDNIKFTKKGWINRNRILVNGKDAYITLPLKKDSDYLDVRDRYLTDNWHLERRKILNKIIESYKKSSNFDQVFPLIESCILFEEKNLFKFIFNSLVQIKGYLGIRTPLIISSTIDIDHGLKFEKKVIEICKAQKATEYLNPIGGIELYSKVEFKENNLGLQFIKTGDIKYKQFDNDFIPYLSIIDVMMFNSKEVTQGYLNSSFSLL